MILEFDTDFIKNNISLNQLVFLNLVEQNQIDHQDAQLLLSQVDESEIQDLLDRNLITITDRGDSKIYSILSKDKSELTFFDEFYRVFPVYVTRPDGSKGFLRNNVNKCRKEYNRIVGKSKMMHQHIMECLNHEISTKTFSGKLGYMKTMWKWLTQREWEMTEEQLKYDNQPTDTYGTDIF